MNTNKQVLSALKLLDPTLLFTDWENGDGEEIGEQLRNAVAALEAVQVEPVATFHCEHYPHDNKSYATPQQAAPDLVAINAELVVALQKIAFEGDLTAPEGMKRIARKALERDKS